MKDSPDSQEMREIYPFAKVEKFMNGLVEIQSLSKHQVSSNEQPASPLLQIKLPDINHLLLAEQRPVIKAWLERFIEVDPALHRHVRE